MQVAQVGAILWKYIYICKHILLPIQQMVLESHYLLYKTMKW